MTFDRRRSPRGARQRGITLIELMLALTIATLVIMAASNAYIVGATTAQTLGNGRDTLARHVAFENTLRDLFEHAYVDADTTDLNTYFISGDVLASKAVTGTTGTTGSSSTNSAASGSASGSNSDTSSLCFTVIGRRIQSNVLSSADDFETNNQNFGPLGGVTEVELGTTPVGQPTGSPTGLFIRQQSPADSDPTQGGRESQLSDDVDTISYEFFDGTDWQTTWDTTTMTPRRLPSAVRITYRLVGDTQDRILVFALPGSDVTPDNPVTETTTS